MPIRLLSPEVASQIAAGEVIERPASVVKELLENSLDAGARTVTIAVEEAGKKLIEVADDGSGIPSNELELAVSRHATSKLVRSADLFSISTLGFRGEALASIGSVARLTITSRVQNEREGARLRVEGGQNGPLTKVGTTVGTTVHVEDLFYNVPANLGGWRPAFHPGRVVWCGCCKADARDPVRRRGIPTDRIYQPHLSDSFQSQGNHLLH
jgi:DNA mismatch repair protein MutL